MSNTNITTRAPFDRLRDIIRQSEQGSSTNQSTLIRRKGFFSRNIEFRPAKSQATFEQSRASVQKMLQLFRKGSDQRATLERRIVHFKNENFSIENIEKLIDDSINEINERNATATQRGRSQGSSADYVKKGLRILDQSAHPIQAFSGHHEVNGLTINATRDRCPNSNVGIGDNLITHTIASTKDMAPCYPIIVFMTDSQGTPCVYLKHANGLALDAFDALAKAGYKLDHIVTGRHGKNTEDAQVAAKKWTKEYADQKHFTAQKAFIAVADQYAKENDIQIDCIDYRDNGDTWWISVDARTRTINIGSDHPFQENQTMDPAEAH